MVLAMVASLFVLPPSAEAITPAAAVQAEPGGVAAGAAPTCVVDSVSTTLVTCSVEYSGGVSQLLIPPGVPQVTATLIGGRGGSGKDGNSGTGGPGASITAAIPVSDGARQLDVSVGGAGATSAKDGGEGGWPGGGRGGASSDSTSGGCGGGGLSSVAVDSRTVLVAGGGGGCGGSALPYGGGSGGTPMVIDATLPPLCVPWLPGFPLCVPVSPTRGTNGTESKGAVPCEGTGTYEHGWAGEGGGAAVAGDGGRHGAQGMYLDGLSCVAGANHEGTDGAALAGGNGGQGEHDGAGGGGGGGGGWFGGGGGGGANHFGAYVGGGGGGGGGLSRVDADHGVVRSDQTTSTGTTNGRAEISYTLPTITTTMSASTDHPAAGTEMTVSARFDGGWLAGKVTFVDSGPDGGPLECVEGERTLDHAAPLDVSCTFTPKVAGSRSIAASKAGSVDGLAGSGAAKASPASSSQPLLVNVERAATDMTLGWDAATNMLKASVASPVPTDGTVAFYLGADPDLDPICDPSFAVTATGSNWFCLIEPEVGTSHGYRATYTGGPNTLGSQAFETVTIENLATTTALTPIAGPVIFGQQVIATAKVEVTNATALPDGTVAFTDFGSTIDSCASVEVVDSWAGCTYRPDAGEHSITAAYGGGPVTKASKTPEPVTFAVDVATPALSLTADPAGGQAAGQPVALRATVKLGDGIFADQGSVSFADGSDPIDRCSDLAVDASGIAMCTFVPTAGDATRTFTATYTGTANIADGGPIDLVGYKIDKRQTRTVLTSESGSDIDAGTPWTVSATVANIPPSGTPTGTVTFYDNGHEVVCNDSDREHPPELEEGVATCTFVPSAGVEHEVNATYSGDPTNVSSSSVEPVTVKVGTFGSTTHLEASPSNPTFGDEVTLTATVDVPDGPRPVGSVAFAERDTANADTEIGTCSKVPVVDGTATCRMRPGAGDHSFVASFSGGIEVAGSGSDLQLVTVAAAATNASVSVQPSGVDQLTAVVTVSPTSGSVTPTGTVTFSVDDQPVACDAVPLAATPGSGTGAARASCTWSATDLLSSAHQVDVTFALDEGFEAPTDPTAVTYTPAMACSAGFSSVWDALATNPADRSIAGDPGTITVTATAPQPSGGCVAATPIGFTGVVSLFGGALTSRPGSPVSGAISSVGGLCLTAGILRPTSTWTNMGELTITAPVCFALSSSGGLGTVSGGQLAATSPVGTFPLVGLGSGLLGARSAKTAVGFDSATGDLLARSVAGPDATPDVVLTLVITTDGVVDGTIVTPGLVAFGQSLSAMRGTVEGPVAGPLTFAGGATLGPIAVQPGLVLDNLVAKADGSGLRIEGRASVGSTGHTSESKVAGPYRAPDDWSLAVTADSAPQWEPLAGLRLPAPTGTIEADGPTGFAVSIGAAGNGQHLTSWKPTPTAAMTIVIDEIDVVDGPACTGLAFAGGVEFGAVVVPVTGCIELATGAYRFTNAPGPSTGPDGLTIDVDSLAVSGSVAGAVSVSGTASVEVTTATSTLTVPMTLRLTADGTFVMGGITPLSAWGLPVESGFVAYASGDLTSFDTGVPAIGSVALHAGTSAAGIWTAPRPGAAVLLEQAGFVLPDGDHITFAAMLSPDTQARFDAELAAPSALPLLRLPDGATVHHVVLTFTADGLGLDAAATIGSPGDVALAIAIDPATGRFTGSASVTDLSIFGRTVTLTGTLEGEPGTDTATVRSSVVGTVDGSFAPTGGPGITWSGVQLTLGPDGIAVDGTMSAGGRDDLTISGVLNASLTVWTLDLRTPEVTVAWTPTEGVDTTAILTGTVSSAQDGPGAPTHITFAVGADTSIRFDADGTDQVLVQVTRIRLSNMGDRPAVCGAAPPNAVWLQLTGTLDAAVGTATGSADAEGCLVTDTGALKVVATLTSLTYTDGAAGVTVTSPILTISRTRVRFAGPNNPEKVITTITAQVGLVVTMPDGRPVKVLEAGMILAGTDFAIGTSVDLSPWLGGNGAVGSLFYASKDLKLKAGTLGLSSSLGDLDLKKGVNFAVRFALDPTTSANVAKAGGGDPGESTLTAIGRYDTEKSAFTFEVGFALTFDDEGSKLFETADGVAMYLDSGFLKVTLSPTAVSFAIGLKAHLHLPPAKSGGQSQDVTLIGEIAVSDTGFSVSVQLGVCGAADGGWHDAFGVEGLTVQCAAVTGGLSYTGVPTVGMTGEITSLPNDVAGPLGYVNGSPMTFAFNFEPFVLSIAIGTANSGQVALRPLTMIGMPDLIEVNYAGLYIAPRAARIGQTSFPAGFGIGFQAKVNGVDLDILGEFDPTAPRLHAHVSMSKVQVGALALGPVVVDLDASKFGLKFSLDASIAIGPADIDLGPLLKISGELGAHVHVDFGITGLSAFIDGYVSGSISVNLAQSTCYYGGMLPYPCDFEWRTDSFSATLPKTGFAINSSGLTLTVKGHDFTLSWSDIASSFTSNAGVSPASAGAPAPTPLGAPIEGPGGAPSGTTAPHTMAGGRSIAGTATSPTETSASASEPGRTALAAEPARSEQVRAVRPVATAGNPTVLAVAFAPEDDDEPAIGPITDPEFGPDDIITPQPVEDIPVPEGLSDDASVIEPPSGDHSTPADVDESEVPTVIAVDDQALPRVTAGRTGGTWRSTGSLHTARAHASSASLPDGRVLVVGGAVGADGATNSTELYDPVTSTWSPAASMNDPRAGATTTVLPDGRILVAGGSNGSEVLATAEIFDPATGSWTGTGAMAQGRRFASMVALADGTVLVAGGVGSGDPDTVVPLAGAEVFDPATGAWHSVADMPTARAFAAAAALQDGSVVVAGGQGPDGIVAATEVFDPASAAWRSVAPMPEPGMMDAVVRLDDGRVLVAGHGPNALVYDPQTDTWAWTGALTTVRSQAVAARLPDGKVLLAGGSAADQVNATAEVYDPATNSWQATPDLPAATSAASVTVLANGAVLVDGGADGPDALAASMVYAAPGVQDIVPAALTPAAPVPTDTDAAMNPTTGPLPFTGSNASGFLVLASILVLSGLIIARFARRGEGRRRI